MEEILRQMLPQWGMEDSKLSQVYSTAWEVNDSCIIKVYDDQEQLERNVKILTILKDCNIPVAEILAAKTGEKYVTWEGRYFLVTRKLPGSNIVNLRDEAAVRKMGAAMARLHQAFLRCEKEMEFWDNSLLKEMQGWIRENLEKNQWQIIGEEEYQKAVESLERMYDDLPKQLIHRDVHFGNFLFHEGNLSGYIDFDLSQRNIRIFDVCYFLAGLLAEETEEPLTKEEWLGNVQAVTCGYESISLLTAGEKAAIPCVMECIEILFAAYYVGMKDMICAREAAQILGLIQSCEKDLAGMLS